MNIPKYLLVCSHYLILLSHYFVSFVTPLLFFFYHSLKELSSSPVEQKKVQNVLNSLPAVSDVMTLMKEVKNVSEVMK